MPSFRWSAINGGGEVVHGVMDAPDRVAVVERLQRQGQIVLRADPAEGAPRASASCCRSRSAASAGSTRTSLVEVTRELAIMLMAGQDLDRALRFVVDNTRSARARKILGNVRDKVRSGSSLARGARRRAAQLFEALYRPGPRRRSGRHLAATLDRLAGLLERERSLTASLRAALIYPALLVVAAIGSIVLLLDYVLPQFTPIFEQAGAAAAGRDPGADDARRRGRRSLAVVLWRRCWWRGLVARQLLARPAYRLPFDRLLLRLPVAGSLIRETLAARLTRTLGSLLENGVPLIPALGIAKDALGNLAAAAAVEAAALQGQGRRRSRPAARRRRGVSGAHDPSVAARRGSGAARGDVAESRRYPRRAGAADDAAAGGAGGAADHDRDGPRRRRDHQRAVDGDAEPQ